MKHNTTATTGYSLVEIELTVFLSDSASCCQNTAHDFTVLFIVVIFHWFVELWLLLTHCADCQPNLELVRQLLCERTIFDCDRQRFVPVTDLNILAAATNPRLPGMLQPFWRYCSTFCYCAVRTLSGYVLVFSVNAILIGKVGMHVQIDFFVICRASLVCLSPLAL